jgi:predicted AlkP superfamily pyrophosphatase or phosphodiesterase
VYAQGGAPRLAVIIVVDQMRADYVQRFRADWTAGLRRLLDAGAWYSNAAFPFLGTWTCAGHATVSTGAFPHRHGIFQNQWWDRGERRLVACTDDSRARGLRYPDGTNNSYSAARLLVPAFADELRGQRKGARVAAVALKARSAIMLAGHGGDAVTWMDETYEHWETSTAYAARPVAAVNALLQANPIDADYGRVWTRRLAADRYVGPDDGEGEVPPRGWTSRFPHALNGDNDTSPDRDFRSQWARSPYADAYVGRLAGGIVEALQLGGDPVTDFLGISFSTPDLVGHAFGPRSQEVQDVYAHLDVTIGALLDRLDALVGRNRYVVALTADHGVALVPEKGAAGRQEAGRVSTARLAELLERTAQTAVPGPGPYIERVNSSDVYFADGAYDRLAKTPAALQSVMSVLSQQPGVARVFSREQLLAGTDSTDALLRAAALSYVARLSGDLVFALKPGWIYNASGTTHGTANADDQRVPIVLMGPGIRRGEFRDAVTPADIAPTLASLTGIVLPRAQGRVLNAALPPGR